MKLDNWENNLNAAIEKHMNSPHDYNLTNCWLFVLDCYEAQTGIKLFPDLRTYKTEKEGYRLFAKKGFKTVGQALSSKLTEVNRYLAQRGDLVTFVVNDVETCGVIVSTGVIARSVYKDGTFGMSHYSLDKIKQAFKVE